MLPLKFCKVLLKFRYLLNHLLNVLRGYILYKCIADTRMTHNCLKKLKTKQFFRKCVT